jgi:prevent-host-death family protein
MQKIIGVTELQRQFRKILDEVTRRKTPYILTRGSRPEAVLIAYDEFLRLQELDQGERAATASIRPPLDFPVEDYGEWPADLSLRREDLYDDWGR